MTRMMRTGDRRDRDRRAGLVFMVCSSWPCIVVVFFSKSTGRMWSVLVCMAGDGVGRLEEGNSQTRKSGRMRNNLNRNLVTQVPCSKHSLAIKKRRSPALSEMGTAITSHASASPTTKIIPKPPSPQSETNGRSPIISPRKILVRLGPSFAFPR